MDALPYRVRQFKVVVVPEIRRPVDEVPFVDSFEKSVVTLKALEGREELVAYPDELYESRPVSGEIIVSQREYRELERVIRDFLHI